MVLCFALLAASSPCRLAASSSAQEPVLESVRTVRREIEMIRIEVQRAEPYPGGQRWDGRLRDLQEKLTQMGGGDSRRFLWFKQAIADFRDRKKEDAARVLDELLRRLTVLEESIKESGQPEAQATEKRSPEDIKSLLRRSEGRNIERKPTHPRVEEDRPEVRREEAREEDPKKTADRASGGRGTPASERTSGGGGFSSLDWLLLGGLALAVVVVGTYLYLTSSRSPRSRKDSPTKDSTGHAQEIDRHQVLDVSQAALWRQADVLATDGRFREAVRSLYLAVLGALHRKQLIRFEPMRTNGEYVRQVRLSELAHPELRESFQRLTDLFEAKWYGELPCQSSDYRSCRAFAEEVQHAAAHV